MHPRVTTTPSGKSTGAVRNSATEQDMKKVFHRLHVCPSTQEQGREGGTRLRLEVTLDLVGVDPAQVVTMLFQPN